jgi:hypothetical protein
MQDKVLTMKFSTPAFALDFEPVNIINNIITASLYTLGEKLKVNLDKFIS